MVATLTLEDSQFSRNNNSNSHSHSHSHSSNNSDNQSNAAASEAPHAVSKHCECGMLPPTSQQQKEHLFSKSSCRRTPDEDGQEAGQPLPRQELQQQEQKQKQKQKQQLQSEEGDSPPLKKDEEDDEQKDSGVAIAIANGASKVEASAAAGGGDVEAGCITTSKVEGSATTTTAGGAGAGFITTSFLEDLLICSLCHERMRQPSSLACGHSFCRHCLRSALRHRKECPMCRATCYTVTDPRPNVVLAALMREAFPGDFDTSGQESLSEGLEQGGEEAGLRQLPLFLASSVQVPQAKCSMHLFEPRYRILTQRALDGGGDFAMVWAQEGLTFPVMVEPASLVEVAACIVHIDVARQTPDGRWNLACSGVSRARIKECWVEEGTNEMYMARLQVLQEDGASSSSSSTTATGNAVPHMGRPSNQPLPPDLGVTRHDRLEFIGSAMESLGVKPLAAPTLRAAGFISAYSSSSSSSSSPPSPEVAQVRAEDAMVWSAAAAMGGPPFGWATDEQLQSLLEKDSLDDRIELLCSMFFKACRERWSPVGFANRCVRRWGPVVAAVVAAYAASAARSCLSSGGQAGM